MDSFVGFVGWKPITFLFVNGMEECDSHAGEIAHDLSGLVYANDVINFKGVKIYRYPLKKI